MAISIRSKLILIFLLLLMVVLRLYRFPQVINFSQEQAQTLTLSATMIQDKKLALIGEPYFIRPTDSGHVFFNSASYLYPLVLIQSLFGYSPIVPTFYYLLLNLLTGFILYHFVRRFFSENTALISLFLFATSPLMISYSHVIWHINTLFPLITLCLYSIFLYFRLPSPILALFLGFLSSLGFSIHLGFAIPALFITLALLFKIIKKHTFSHIPPFILGLLIGYAPLLLFDLRHHFYNLTTMIQFMFSSSESSGFSFTGYHFHSLIIPLFVVSALILNQIRLHSKTLFTVLILFYLAYSAPHFDFLSSTPPGMTAHTNLSLLQQTAAIISQDHSEAFQIADLTSGDTRAQPLRYLTTYEYQAIPLPPDQYSAASSMYVLASSPDQLQSADNYELNSLKPFQIVNSWPLAQSVTLFKIKPSQL